MAKIKNFNRRLSGIISAGKNHADRVQALLGDCFQQAEQGNLNWLQEMVKAVNEASMPGIRQFNRHVSASVSGYSVKDGKLAKGKGKVALTDRAAVPWTEPFDGQTKRTTTYKVDTRLAGLLEKIQSDAATIEKPQEVLTMLDKVKNLVLASMANTEAEAA